MAGLKKTAESVWAQTYRDYEHIIIDGGSSDGTKEFLKANQERWSHCTSEPDSGVYDAMNKGIDQITGEYVLFLNSGDWLNNPDVLSDFVGMHPREDFVYGDSIFVHPDKPAYKKTMPDELKGVVIFERTLNHQSVFHKSTLFSHKRYDLDYRMLADWAFYNYAILMEGASYRHIDMVVSNYDTTGFSSNPSNAQIMYEDRYRFYRAHLEYIIPEIVKDYSQMRKNFKALSRKKAGLIERAIRWIRNNNNGQ